MNELNAQVTKKFLKTQEMRLCKHHGQILHTQNQWQWGFVCAKCNSERVQRNRRKQKRTLIEELGNCCELCGYDKCYQALEFHHIDPKTKLFGLGSNTASRSMTKMREEAKKCILLCANCHREVEYGISMLTGAMAARHSVKVKVPSSSLG